MNLRERLRLLNAAGNPKPAPESTHESTVAESPSPTTMIPGSRLIPTPLGAALCVEHTYPLEMSQGCVSLSSLTGISRLGWQRLMPVGSEFSIRNAAFLDTETTGLERGAGTYAFLIGIGRIVGETFRVRQFFMRDYDDEPALIAAAMAELADIELLITFNGKTFDWPLLQTRAIMNRTLFRDVPHLDILHPARRFWQQVTQSCRLVQLEQEILAVTRVGDVPGFLIPQLYFEFLTSRDPLPLIPVITHNRLDILSTAALTGYIGQAFSAPLEAKPAGKPLPGSDLYAIGRLLVDQGHLAEAFICLEEALARPLPRALEHACQRLIGNAYKRARRFDRAVEIWQAMVNQSRPSIFALIELAKYYEHQAKDHVLAREATLQAIEVVQRRRLMQGLGTGTRRLGDEAELQELVHRLARLESRLAKQKDGRVSPSATVSQ